MAVLYPFAQALPTELQVPTLQPEFSQIQGIAQRANNIFETGLGHVKNAYSSVINAPVTSSRNLEKKQEYVRNFRDGLKKITKEDLRMPQNAVQAENLLSPFWQDNIMLTDMGQTAQLQSQMSRYEQAANSTDEKIRASANPESLEDLNNFAEKLRNAGDDINNYTKLGTPKYLPLDRVNDYMTDLMIKDKDDANITFTTKYQLDQDGNYARDANGQLILLPHGELIKQTNGILALPAKTHLAGTRIGNRFDAQYELRAKNQYNRAVKAAKQQYQGINDADAERLVDQQFYSMIKEPVQRQLQTYIGAIDTYKSRIESLEKQAAGPTGLTKKQQDDLDITREMLKDAEQKQVELTNAITDMDSNSGKITSNFIQNRLAHTYKYQDIHQWGETMAYKNVKSEVIKDEPYFATLEANDRRYGHALTRQRDQWNHQEAMMANDIALGKAIADDPNLAAWYRARGINVPDIAPIAGGYTNNGLPQAASIAGLATNLQDSYNIGKLHRDMRAMRLGEVNQGLYGVPSQSNPNGGLIFAIQDKFTTNEFDALRKYQEMHLNGNLTYLNGTAQFRPQSVQEGKDYESAINKLCILTGKDRKSIKSLDDINNIIVDVVGTNLSQYMNDGVNHDKIAQYTSVFSKTKAINDNIRREDIEQDQLAADIARRNPEYNRYVVTKNGKPHIVGQTDIPIHSGIEGTDAGGKLVSYTAKDLREKYLNGAIEVSTRPNVTYGMNGEVIEQGAPIFDGLIIDGKRITTSDRTMQQFLNDYNIAHNRFGSSKDVGTVRSKLYEQAIPNRRYYESLTGETDKFVKVPITGKTTVGKKEKDNDINLNYLSEVIMPGNNIGIEDPKGVPINDDATIDALTQLFNNKTDAVKYIGDNFGYLPADKLGRKRWAVKINKLPEVVGETKSPYVKAGITGKTFIITQSPGAQGDYLSSLPSAPDRKSYDPLLSDDPTLNAEYPNKYQRDLGVDSKLTYNKTRNEYNIVGTYYETDKASGQRVKKTMNRTIDGSYAPYEVRGAFQQMNDQAVNATIASNKLHISTNGSKVQPQNGNR